MIENNQAIVLWNRCLNFIKDNINNARAFETWFEPIVPLKYENKALTIGVPSPFFYEYLEEKYVGLLRAAIYKEIGEGTELMYSILTDKTNHITVNMEGTKRSSALPPQAPVHNANKAPNPLQAAAPQDLDPHLNPNYNFENFIKGTSNEFSRTVAETVAQNPARTFNPLFLYGPSGVGKTHLINAIGTRIKELYPEKRVLYVSAHLFQVQYTDSVRTNHFNDFISFYQTIDVLIIDDIQEFAATLEELCEKSGVNLEGLKEQLAVWNKAVETKNDLQFGRKDQEWKIEKGPYYLIRMFSWNNLSCGGVRVTEHFEVLGWDMKPIKGFYAAGETVAGVHGAFYCGGNACGFAHTSGYILNSRVSLTS